MSTTRMLQNIFSIIIAISLSILFFTGYGKSEEKSGKEVGEKESAKDSLPSELIVEFPGGQKLELVKVEAGSFEMSAKDGDNKTEEVPHQATLTKDFYIGQTEVTQAQWKALMGNNPSRFKGDDLPMEHVSWNDAMVFCEKLNSTGKAPNGWRFTLPTETQWEYAARGGKKSKGYKYSGSNNIDEVAWYGNNKDRTHPVGKKKANELGLYDMSGNVFEWCLDDFQLKSDSLKAEFTRGNDQGGSERALRGGCWYCFAKVCRSADRMVSGPSNRSDDIGFRLVLVFDDGYGVEKQTNEKDLSAQKRVQTPPGDKTIVLSGNVKIEMMKVEAGTFEMSAKDEDGESFAFFEVPHQATLTKDFYIGQTEVTQAQWEAVAGTNPSDYKGDDLPVEHVSWNDAMVFCEKLNSTGKAPNGWRFTLPTETQWEYAARGGKKSKGYKYSGSNNIDEVAWYGENSGDKMHPVGQKKANELGLYDMSGNVWEMCLDDYVSKSDELTPEFTRGNDQRGNRVKRGGCWYCYARICRSAERSSTCYLGIRSDDIGFRLVLVQVQ